MLGQGRDPRAPLQDVINDEVRGTALYMTGNPEAVPTALVHDLSTR